jgi:hypothetical protein
LRKAERIISAPRRRVPTDNRTVAAPSSTPPDNLGDPRIAKIINDIPQRRTRSHAYA